MGAWETETRSVGAWGTEIRWMGAWGTENNSRRMFNEQYVEQKGPLGDQ